MLEAWKGRGKILSCMVDFWKNKEILGANLHNDAKDTADYYYNETGIFIGFYEWWTGKDIWETNIVDGNCSKITACTKVKEFGNTHSRKLDYKTDGE